MSKNEILFDNDVENSPPFVHQKLANFGLMRFSVDGTDWEEVFAISH